MRLGDRHDRLADHGDPDGQPQTFPIWFLWATARCCVYSDRRAKRNGNIGANPRVALHLNDDGRGNDIVIVEGEARIDDATPPVPRTPPTSPSTATWIREMLTPPRSCRRSTTSRSGSARPAAGPSAREARRRARGRRRGAAAVAGGGAAGPVLDASSAGSRRG